METKGLQYVFHGRVRFVEFVVLFFSVSFKYSREMKKKIQTKFVFTLFDLGKISGYTVGSNKNVKTLNKSKPTC